MEKVYVSMTFSSEYGERTVNFRRVDFTVDDVVEVLNELSRKNPEDKRLIAVKRAFDTLFVTINNKDFYNEVQKPEQEPEKPKTIGKFGDEDNLNIF